MTNKKQIHEIRKAAKKLKAEIEIGHAIKEGKLKTLNTLVRDLLRAIDGKPQGDQIDQLQPSRPRQRV